MPAASCGKLRVRVYRLRPIACQTVTTTTAHRIVTGAYATLYRGMDRAQLDAAYNNSAAVPERAAIFADWAARSAKVRREYAGRLDLAYGDAPRERLDLFLAADPTAPTRWRSPPRSRFSPSLRCRSQRLGGEAKVRAPE